MSKPKQPTPAPAIAPAGNGGLFNSLSAQLPKAVLPVFIIYSLMVVVGAFNHESWADEAQAWLLARDLTLTDLFKTLPSEGHPPLWYLLLFPFAKAGMPYETIKVFSALFAIGAMYVLLFKTKAPLALKLTVPFHYYMVFQYAIFGRSYSMMLFFVMAAVGLYPKRFDKPLLFALCIVGLFNTHMLIFTFAGTLALLFVIDGLQEKQPVKKLAPAALLMFVGGAYLLSYLGSSEMSAFFAQKVDHHFSKVGIGATLGLVLNKLTSTQGHNNYYASEITYEAIPFIVLALATIVRPKAFVLLIGGLAGIVYIIGFRYSDAQLRHYGAIFVVLAATYAIAAYYKNDVFNIPLKRNIIRYAGIIMGVVIIFQLPVVWHNYRNDVYGMYSGSKDAAEYINEHIPEDAIIVAAPTWSTLSILPYLPKKIKFYNAACERFGSYYIYDSCFTREAGFDNNQILQIIYSKFRNRLGNTFMIFNFEIDLKAAYFLEEVYATPEQVLYKQEQYFIYRFKKPYIPAS